MYRTVPPCLDNFSCSKKAGDLFVPIIEAQEHLSIGKFDLKPAMESN
jgi:hypothetical protein